jgi:hypothetical protein
MADTSAGGGADALSAEGLKKALKAFKKRLKLTRLDHESRINASPLSGRASHVAAITPPNQFPAAVWEELARQGKLKKMEGGTYALAQE